MTSRSLVTMIGIALSLVVPFANAADPIILSCTYPHRAVSDSPDGVRATPRALQVDTAKSTASWNDVSVPATIGDTSIHFAYSGFEYMINRLNGEIVFANPTKLSEWRRYRAEMLRAAQASGRPEELARATKSVDALQSRDFAGSEHVGRCDVATTRKF